MATGSPTPRPIASMTGYASATVSLPRASLMLEVKSVNSRFLDLQFRLPEELRPVEPLLRERITARVQRGKVECRIALSAAGNAASELVLNASLLAALAAAERQVREAIPHAQPLRVGEVLHWPGMLGDDQSGDEGVRNAAVSLAEQALAEFAASREREGDKLRAMILERVDAMERLLAEIGPRLPEAIAAYQERLAAKLREVLSSGEENRIQQEVALYGVKVDVAEELNRLGAHLQETRRVLAAGGAVGKRLDFLMQELNREANTLGSKSVSKELADASLAFKLAIEQIREQVQNLE